jgi:hypothetical protein
MSINKRRLISKVTPSLGYGNCNCCGTYWHSVKGKIFSYSKSDGCFPICELCFDELLEDGKIKTIINYYHTHLDKYSNIMYTPKEHYEKLENEILNSIGVEKLRDIKIKEILDKNGQRT